MPDGKTASAGCTGDILPDGAGDGIAAAAHIPAAPGDHIPMQIEAAAALRQYRTDHYAA